MLITDDFVMLNFPKTGSTFAREALTQLYSRRESKIRKRLADLGICKPNVIELLMPHLDDDTGIIDQHGTLRQIPFEYRNKPIISIVRSPLTRYQSTYLFRWWEQNPPADTTTIRERFPNFPNLSFLEYYEMINFFGSKTRLRKITPKIDLGVLSIQFIQFYFYDPESVLMKIDDEYIETKQFEKDMGKIHFIHMENLRKELVDYLLQKGIPQHQLDFIYSLEKINVTPNKNERVNILDTMIEEKIREKEKLLFKLFPIYKNRQAFSE